MVYAQSEILQKQVFLFEHIDAGGQKTLKHLNAICFLRPVEENIQILERELHEPKYGSYYICKFLFIYIFIDRKKEKNRTYFTKILLILSKYLILKE